MIEIVTTFLNFQTFKNIWYMVNELVSRTLKNQWLRKECSTSTWLWVITYLIRLTCRLLFSHFDSDYVVMCPSVPMPEPKAVTTSPLYPTPFVALSVHVLSKLRSRKSRLLLLTQRSLGLPSQPLSRRPMKTRKEVHFSENLTLSCLSKPIRLVFELCLVYNTVCVVYHYVQHWNSPRPCYKSPRVICNTYKILTKMARKATLFNK